MDTLEGRVERITYRNDDNGYTVFQLRPPGKGEMVTVIGNFPMLCVGESLKLTGRWTTHVEYGRQFEAESFESMTPTTLEGVKQYIGSGLIPGIGESMAERIVDEFGLETLEVMENDPHLLKKVPGIGEKKLENITQAFEEQQEIREVMVYLQGYGISPTYATRIYGEYGEKTVEKLNENPYCLTQDIFGIGFKKADEIARNMGVAPDSPERLQAGIRYLLRDAADNGNVYLEKDDLLAEAAVLLEVEGEGIRTALNDLEQKEEIFIEDNRVYFAPFYYAEKGTASRLNNLLRAESGLEFDTDFELALHDFERAEGFQLAGEQRKAVKKALDDGVLVITGGPGTGKTTIVNCIINLLEKAAERPPRIALAAPTGRAAKRLGEATGREASTIHRLLGFGYVPGEGMTFRHDQNDPLSVDVLIIDETSMVDLMLMYNLMKALTPDTRLILVGDVDQLPAVGAGNVLRDIIASGVIPVVRLKHIFRQARESEIIVNAHRINRGDFPRLENRGKEGDFFFLERNEPEEITETIVGLCSRRLRDYMQCDPITDIQVISPMRRTVTGIENLNDRLHDELNPPAKAGFRLKQGGREFRNGDKVMQIRNNYQKEVFNGDMGTISHIDTDDELVFIDFPDSAGNRRLAYSVSELKEIVLAYAISVHKSQGSEYRVVVMPVTTQHYIMLQRNLLYTAITRAKEMVVLVGSKKAIGIAVNNNRIEERNTRLAERLRDE